MGGPIPPEPKSVICQHCNCMSLSPEKPPLSAEVQEFDLHLTHLRELVKCIEREYKSTTEKLSKLTEDDGLPFKLLWSKFPIGDLAACRDAVTYERIAFIVKEAYYTSDFASFIVSGTRLEWSGKVFAKRKIEATIPSYLDLVRIHTHAVYPITSDIYTELLERGRKYLQLCRRSLVSYKGVFYHFSTENEAKEMVDGRVMLDIETWRHLNPQDDYIYRWDNDVRGELCNFWDERDSRLSEVTEEDEIVTLLPWMVGWSFETNSWGKCVLDCMSPNTFDDRLIDGLLMDSDQKQLIINATKSLKNLDNIPEPWSRFSGARILLHGPPGTGKTLTAYAISESLQVPLQRIKLSSIRSTSQNLSSVRYIIKLANIWSSVLLLDGADVVLEAPAANDSSHHTNLLTLLNILDNFKGVVFLISNRIQSYDPRLISRLSLAIKYNSLSRQARETLLRKLLTLAGVSVLEDPTSAPLPPLGPPLLQTAPLLTRTASEGAVPSSKAIDADFPEVDTVSSASDAATVKKDSEVFNAVSYKDLKSWASHPFDGRQINELVKTAQLVAAGEGGGLCARHVESVVKSLVRCHVDFVEADDESYIVEKNERWSHKIPLYS
ncbi:P-loop containing nucleoside triphosphate hydrolase protein [Atractiella rhizophila]|nr:P-loop containing nucleoside triphosphate hydrolase protein [Atractiella rhizophila]